MIKAERLRARGPRASSAAEQRLLDPQCPHPAELEEFFAQRMLLKLSWLRPDGWPYIVPLWVAWFERKLYVVARERRGLGASAASRGAA